MKNEDIYQIKKKLFERYNEQSSFQNLTNDSPEDIYQIKKNLFERYNDESSFQNLTNDFPEKNTTVENFESIDENYASILQNLSVYINFDKKQKFVNILACFILKVLGFEKTVQEIHNIESK